MAAKKQKIDVKRYGDEKPKDNAMVWVKTRRSKNVRLAQFAVLTDGYWEFSDRRLDWVKASNADQWCYAVLTPPEFP